MTNILLGIALVAFVLVRQIRPRPVSEKSATRLISILGLIGFVETAQAVGKVSTTAATAAITAIAAGLVVAAVLGAVRAHTMVLWHGDDGAVWQRGRPVTAVLWVVSIAIHLGLDVAVTGVHGASSVTSASTLLFLAASLGVQRELVSRRASNLVPAAAR